MDEKKKPWKGNYEGDLKFSCELSVGMNNYDNPFVKVQMYSDVDPTLTNTTEIEELIKAYRFKVRAQFEEFANRLRKLAPQEENI